MGNIGVVRDSSHGRSESLRLGGGPVLPLVGLRHRLVRHLSSSTVDRGSSMHHRGSMDNWGSMHHRGSNHRSMVGRASNSSDRDSLRVGSSSITGLSSIEVGVGVVISNSIVVGVRRDLISINLSNSMGNGSMVSRGSMHHRGMVSGGSMDHRSMISRGSVNNRSMVGRANMSSMN